MKKRLTLLSFPLGAPLLLVSSLWLLSTSSRPQITPPTPQILGSAFSQSSIPPASRISITTADARPLIIRQYLHQYASPLEPFAELLVSTSDKYSIDYRLLAAIAQQESNLCKKIPANSHNCWGYGIYGNLVTRFNSYPEAIEIVARSLRKNYLDLGLDTPEEIMAKYTPPSVEIGGPWAKGVSRFLSELE